MRGDRSMRTVARQDQVEPAALTNSWRALTTELRGLYIASLRFVDACCPPRRTLAGRRSTTFNP